MLATMLVAAWLPHHHAGAQGIEHACALCVAASLTADVGQNLSLSAPPEDPAWDLSPAAKLEPRFRSGPTRSGRSPPPDLL